MIKAYLIVYEAPLFKESVHTHNRADISCQISPASSDRQIFYWIQTICVDHEISVVLVNSGRLASIPVVEEFWESFPFDSVDFVHVEPCAVAWENDRMCLRDEVLACR